MKNYARQSLFFLAILLIVMYGLRMFNTEPVQVVDVPFSQVYTSLEKGDVKSINFMDRKIKGTLKNGQEFRSFLPYAVNSEAFSEQLLKNISKNDLILDGEIEPQDSWFWTFLPSIVLIVMLLGFLFFTMQQPRGGVGTKVNNFGKARAKLNVSDNKIRFDNVAGLDEEKEELKEVVDFLKNPKKYLDLGARIPKGILLVGQPGTGKTYLSKAVAGESGVPFFSMSGSDFVEMFVGVGASRVRDLFEQAKKNSPCILFIDEIDAVGRRRGAGFGGGHDEREQTLNQLLVEMDGFTTNQGIIVMAATNRADVLDPALLRPGRFDRQVMVAIPDKKGRTEILKVHSKNKHLAADVNIETVAKRTPGFTPADLENMLNEAAILTARENGKEITMTVIEEAITKVIAGIPKKSRIITDKEKKLTAYHEAGHAVVARLLPDFDPVHHVTIIPRGMAGGFTMTLPDEDEYFVTKSKLEKKLVDLLGGRVAEELIMGDISTGASNDLQRVSQIARNMVTKYAFSPNLPSMTFDSDSDEVFLGKDFTTRRNYSEEVASQIDTEVEKIVTNAYDTTKRLLTQNIDKLHNVAKALIHYETLNKEDFEKAFNGQLSLEDENVTTITEA
ncbi:ATP-dependent zinc metalloprotease FtsH [Criibacterium bergeronii]|uniref:ATP-dependent zinc metalloprotease FtsH n=1 Tax=Criibacterium bergeronii TaxID=1871336 RepID=A0A552VB88_9FIRM|nr:ATP-dependent zinc metalloprotease FtsH [Criibacterium bergeronii]TRW27732.1 ATP-dependent zinc metalloprotease FtsH [Criibacterium bergeronii]